LVYIELYYCITAYSHSKESINYDDLASARDFAKLVSATSTALDDHIFVILQNHLLVLV